MSSSATSSDSESGFIKVTNESFTVEWIINKFSLPPYGTEDSIFSPRFPTVNKELKCCLELYPQGEWEEDTGYVGIFLYVDPHRNDKFINSEIDAEISIVPSGITNKIQFTYKGRETDGWGNNKLIQRSELLKLCASDDTVTIRMRIDMPRKTVSEKKHMKQAFDSQEGRLSQDFHRLFKELPKLNDVVVIVGNQTFPAHKVVLAARSPVFSAMFANKETLENLENKVKIEEMEPAVVEAMLEFFYTDEVANLKELACELLGAAEKYDIPRLRSICEKFLCKTLNNENAAEILIHTDLYHSHELKKHVMEFMANHLSDVVESESYKEMEEKYPALLKELIRSVAVQHKLKKRKLTY